MFKIGDKVRTKGSEITYVVAATPQQNFVYVPKDAVWVVSPHKEGWAYIENLVLVKNPLKRKLPKWF